MSKKKFNFLAHFFRLCRKNGILRVQKNLLRKNKFFEKENISYHFQTLSKNLSEFRQKIFEPLVKRFQRTPLRHSTFPEKHIEEFFFEKKYNFQIIFRLSEKLSEFWWKIYDRVVKTTFYASIASFSAKKKNFNTFRSFCFFFSFCGKIFVKMSKLHCTWWSEEFFRNIQLKIFINLKKFLDFERKIFRLCSESFQSLSGNVFDRVVKTAF